METALLRDFVVLAQYLNFTSASKSLNMSQSTLSRHIEELERTLGADLVTHEGKVALTSAGKAQHRGCGTRGLLRPRHRRASLRRRG